MAAPHVQDDPSGKRWGVEIPFDDLDCVLPETGRLTAYRQRVRDAGQAAAARLRAKTHDR